MKLDELDLIFDRTPGFRVVGELKLDESGVDPIGLRQINLDLMDATVPGINNVTQHIRPYAFMAWAWWRASQYAVGAGMTPEKIVDLVERYEALYAWSNSIARTPFRGDVTVRKYLNFEVATGRFTFAGPDWDSYKNEKTGFMAPTEYGPSIKALHFLKPEGGLFAWALEAMPAIEVIEDLVSSVLPERLLRPEPPTVTLDDVRPLAGVLPIDKPSAEEMNVFRHLFYDIGGLGKAGKDMRRRKATADLLRAILVDEGPLDIDGIRRRFAGFDEVVAYEGDDTEMRNTALLLCHLQARQLQRLATESTMLWVEVFLSSRKGMSLSTDEIVAAAHNSAAAQDQDYASSRTVGDYLALIEGGRKWPAAAMEFGTDVVELLGLIRHAQQKERSLVPGVALRSLAVVRAIAKSFEGTVYPDGVMNSMEKRPDRMPMGMMARRMDALADRPLPMLWKEIIESWIIGQHGHWSAVRGGDGKKRLRIGLEGDGWMLVRPKPSRGFGATPDRLWTFLSLGSSCGLFKIRGDGLYEAA